MSDNDELDTCPVPCPFPCPPCRGDWSDPVTVHRHVGVITKRLVNARRAVGVLLSLRVLPQHYSLDLADALDLPYEGAP